MNRSYRSFRTPGLPKADIDTYIERVKPYIKTLIVEQLKELQSAKVQMHMWVQWKKPVELIIELDPEDLEGAQDLEYLGGSGDNFIRVDKPFNSKMTEQTQILASKRCFDTQLNIENLEYLHIESKPQ